MMQLKCKWTLSATQESWIASAVFVGMALGSYTWGTISDAYGRKIGFFAPACFTAIFGGASAFAPNYVVCPSPVPAAARDIRVKADANCKASLQVGSCLFVP
jgi:MFS family permease